MFLLASHHQAENFCALSHQNLLESQAAGCCVIHILIEDGMGAQKVEKLTQCHMADQVQGRDLNLGLSVFSLCLLTRD